MSGIDSKISTVKATRTSHTIAEKLMRKLTAWIKALLRSGQGIPGRWIETRIIDDRINWGTEKVTRGEWEPIKKFTSETDLVKS